MPIRGVSAGSAQPKYMTILPPRPRKRPRSGSVASSRVEIVFSLSRSRSGSNVRQSISVPGLALARDDPALPAAARSGWARQGGLGAEGEPRKDSRATGHDAAVDGLDGLHLGAGQAGGNVAALGAPRH